MNRIEKPSGGLSKIGLAQENRQLLLMWRAHPKPEVHAAVCGITLTSNGSAGGSVAEVVSGGGR